jgi:periplasmic protein CpxP/Spy
MTTCRTLVSSVVLAASLGFAAAPVAAMPRDCGPRGNSGEFMEYRADCMAQHQKKLHAALKLTPEQEAAWTKFTATAQPMAKDRPAMSNDWAKLTTPERADKMLERMKMREAQQTEHVAALKEFYAVLTAEQKKAFDDFHANMWDGLRAKRGHRGSGMGKATPAP